MFTKWERGETRTYKTGRHYDTAQELVITYVDIDVDGDPYFKVVDASRNMTIWVELDEGFVLTHLDGDMCKAILMAYDDGRYHLSEWAIVSKHNKLHG